MGRNLKGKLEMMGRRLSDKQQLVSRRTAKRYRMSGIVAFENSGEAIVMIIHDFSKNGVSFLHSVYWCSEDNKIVMDILVYDIESCNEYLVDGVNGWVQSTNLIADEVSNGPIWRTRVAFNKLNASQQERLENLPWTDFAVRVENENNPPAIPGDGIPENSQGGETG
jgi:hypothetical protein